MKLTTALLACLLVATVLAGCGDPDVTTREEVHTRPPVAADKGAVTGLVIDDRYRPVPGALVLLTPGGLTATADADGTFAFGNLDPGAYLIQTQAEGHEAAPVNVEISAGQYSEIEVQARRIFSEGGRIVTLQYSIFTPCAASGVLVSAVHGYCFLDNSGDSYRPGLQNMDFRDYEKNLTYLIGEVKINQPDNYVFVLRCDDGSSFGCGEWGAGETKGGDYTRVVLHNGGNYMGQPTSINWTNDAQLAALLFFYGTGGDELSSVATPAGCTVTDTFNSVSPEPFPQNPLNQKPILCRYFYGAGHKMAIEANVVLTLFLGEPEVDIAGYAVLGTPLPPA